MTNRCSRALPQAVQSGAAAESLLFHPALGEALAPQLYAPFRDAMGSAPTGMPPPPPRPAKRPAGEDAEVPQVTLRTLRLLPQQYSAEGTCLASSCPVADPVAASVSWHVLLHCPKVPPLQCCASRLVCGLRNVVPSTHTHLLTEATDRPTPVLLQAEDAIDMTPHANGHMDGPPLLDGEDIPLPDAMDFHPEEDIVPPTTGAWDFASGVRPCTHDSSICDTGA